MAGVAIQGVKCRRAGAAALAAALLAGATDVPAAEPVILRGHAADVFAASFTPDGGRVVTGGADDTARVWDASTGKELRRLLGHTGPVTSLATSGDGRTLATGGQDAAVRIWSLPLPGPRMRVAAHPSAGRALALLPDGRGAVSAGGTGVRLWNLDALEGLAPGQAPAAPGVVDRPGHEANVTAAATSPDGSTFVTADESGRMLLWSPFLDEPLGTPGLHAGGVEAVAFLADGQRFVSAGRDGTIRTWAVPPQPPRVAAATAAPIRALATVPNQPLVVAAHDDAVRVVDSQSLAVVREFPRQAAMVGALAVAPDGSLAALADEGGTIRVVRPADGAEVGRVAGHTGAIHDVGFLPDGKSLLSAGADGTLRQWAVPQAQAALAGHAATVLALAGAPSGRWFASSADDKTVRVWSTEGQPPRTVGTHAAPVAALAISPDESSLATGDAAGTVAVWSAADAASQGSIGAHRGAVRALAHDRGAAAIWSAGADGALKRWRLPIVPPRALPGHSQAIRAAAASTDGSRAVTGGQDQTVRLWDVAAGQTIRSFGDQPAGPVAAVATSADGALVAAVTDTGSLRVWRGTDGMLLLERVLPGGAATDVAVLGPRHVATIGEDNVVRLWDSAATPETAPAPESAPLDAIAVSRDGARVALGGAFGGRPTIVVRSRGDGQTVGTFTVPAAPITAVALSRQGDHVACGAGQGVVAWNAAGGDPLSLEALPGPVVALAIADDGRSCFVATGDAVIRQMSLVDGREIGQFTGHTLPVRQLLLDGERLVSGGDDGVVVTWDVATRTQTRSVPLGAPVRAIDVAPSGRVAAATAARTLHLWTMNDAAAPLVLPALPQDVASLRWAPDGALVAVAAADGVRVVRADGVVLEAFAVPARTCTWRTDTARLLAHRADGSAVPLAVAAIDAVVAPDSVARVLAAPPDGSLLVASGSGKRLLGWRIEGGRFQAAPPKALGAGPARVTDLAFSADGKTLASAGEDGRVAVWDAAALASADASPRVTIAHTAPVRGVAILAAGARLALAADDGIVTYDIATGREGERQVATGQGVVAATAGGTFLSGGADGVARVSTPALDRLLPLGDAPADACAALEVLPGDAGIVVLGTGKPGLGRVAPDGRALPPLFPGIVPVRLAATADGGKVAAIDAGGNLALWTAADGAVAGPFPIGAGVTALAFSRDGAQIVVADGAARLRAFTTDAGRLVEELPLPAPALSVAVTGIDGRSWAAFGREPQGVLARRGWLATWIGGTVPVQALAMSPDGARAFAGLSNGRILEFAATNGAIARTLADSPAAVSSLALDPAGGILAAAGDDGVRLWSLADGAVRRVIAKETRARRLAFGPAAGKRLASVDADGLVHLWDAVTAAPIETVALHRGGPAAIAWHTDGQTVLSAGRDGRLTAWRGGGLASVEVSQAPLVSLAGAGGTLVFVADGGAVKVVDAANATVVRTVAEGLVAPLVVAPRPDQQRLAIGSADGVVRLVEPGGGAEVGSLRAEGPVRALAWRADGQRLAVGTRSGDGVPAGVSLFGVPVPQQPGLELDRFDAATADAEAVRLSFDRDGRDLWALHADGTLARWAPAVPTALFKLDHGGPVLAVAVSRDGRTIVSGGADQSVRVWDAATGQQRAQMGGHTGPIHALAFTPDDAFVVSAAADRTLRLWDVAGGRQLKQVATTGETVYAIAVHPSGQTVAAGGADRAVQLVNLLSGATERTLSGHGDFIHGVAYNPSGSTLLSYGYAGELRIWGLATATPLLDTRVGRIGNAAAFDPRGERIVIADGDGTAAIIEVPPAAR